MRESQLTIQVVDQTGVNKQSLELVVPSLQLTARELIHLRVHDEFISAKMIHESESQRVKEIRKDLEGKTDKQFIWMDSLGKINPDSTWEIEAEKACQNFRIGRFIIIAAGKQLEDLDTKFILAPESTVEFIKLVPLIGG